MATSEKAVSGSSGDRPWWGELLSAGIYKRTQGRLARQFTCLAIWVLVGTGCWQLAEVGLAGKVDNTMRCAIPTILGLLGAWVGFRIVNIPQFADFLIAVEAEMNKVSWPSRDELVRVSIVVIGLMAFLTVVLFAYDIFWRALLMAIGVLPPPAPPPT